MTEIPYQSLVWLTYRLAMTFAIGVPLILVIWASILKESAILRLLIIYWKVTSLMGISLLLLTEHRPIGYITFFIAPILMVISIWYWIDLNEELDELPVTKGLPLTTRIWRFSLSTYALFHSVIGFLSIDCLYLKRDLACNSWLELPNSMHQITEILFGFLFGATWSNSLAAFFGYVFLIGYVVTLIQWFLIKLPRNGRIAGDF